jgi:hypothetical protein
MVTVVMSITMVTAAAKFTFDFLFSLVTCITTVISAMKITFGFLFGVVSCCPHPTTKSHCTLLPFSNREMVVGDIIYVQQAVSLLAASCRIYALKESQPPLVFPKTYSLRSERLLHTNKFEKHCSTFRLAI